MSFIAWDKKVSKYPVHFGVLPIVPECTNGSHVIVLDEPAGKTSKGVCLTCGKTGTYPNASSPSYPWIAWEH